MFLLAIPFFNYAYQVNGAIDIWFFFVWLDWTITPLLIAIVYKSRILRQRQPFPAKVPKPYRLGGRRTYKHDLQDFCVEIEYCAYACCCTCLYARFGDTFATTGAGNFWTIQLFCLIPHSMVPIMRQAAVEIDMIVAEEGGTAPLGLGPGHLNLIVLSMYVVLSLYLAKRRQLYRQRLGDKALRGFLSDTLLILACTTCVAVQDARQVDEATLTRVECCCRLVHTEAPGGDPVVGGPIKVSTGSELDSAISATSLSSMRSSGSAAEGDEYVPHRLLPEPLPEQRGKLPSKNEQV